MYSYEVRHGRQIYLHICISSVYVYKEKCLMVIAFKGALLVHSCWLCSKCSV